MHDMSHLAEKAGNGRRQLQANCRLPQPLPESVEDSLPVMAWGIPCPQGPCLDSQDLMREREAVPDGPLHSPETTDCLPYGYEVLIAETSVPAWLAGEGRAPRSPSILRHAAEVLQGPRSSGHQKDEELPT